MYQLDDTIDVNLNPRQAKQIQIDDLLLKLSESGGEVERLREEKDQEIQLLQEGLDSTIRQMSDAQQVCRSHSWRSLNTEVGVILKSQTMSDQATNAQIDTLILDNRKRLNHIIGDFQAFTTLVYDFMCLPRFHFSSMRTKD